MIRGTDTQRSVIAELQSEPSLGRVATVLVGLDSLAYGGTHD
jgi:hypothetical protein